MTLCQYILLPTMKRQSQAGEYIAQGIHAAMAAIHKFKNHIDTIKYLEKLEDMTTIVLEINNIEDTKQLLEKNDIDHYVWLEKPEMIHTAIALRPMLKNEKLSALLKPYKLFKGKKNL